MFNSVSNVTNQMSSWLGGVLKKPESATTTSAPVDGEVHQPQSSQLQPGVGAGSPTSNISTKGSTTADERNEDASSGTESADKESLTSGPDSPMSETGGDGGAVDADGERKPSIQEEVTAASTKAIQGAKTLGNFLFTSLNKAGAKIKKTVEQTGPVVNVSIPILSDFQREQEDFLKSKASGETKKEGLPPWVGYADEELLKEQILALSADKRNFIRPPPAGVTFTYDHKSMQPIAKSILEEDPELGKMRFSLVPKIIKEEEFWRNYFYRVSLICQSSELSALARQENEASTASAPTTVTVSARSTTRAAVAAITGSSSSAQAANNRHSSGEESGSRKGDSDSSGSTQPRATGASHSEIAAIRKSLESLKAKHEAKEEDWERELSAELQEYEVLSTTSGQSKDGAIILGQNIDELDKEIEDLLEEGDDDLK